MATTRPPGSWTDDHDDDTDGLTTDQEAFWEPPRTAITAPFVPRVAFVGSNRETLAPLVTGLASRFVALGTHLLIVLAAPGIYTDASRLRLTLADILAPARIVGVALGGNDDDAALLHAVMIELTARYWDAALLLLAVENASTATPLGPALVHFTVAVTAAGGTAPDADLIVCILSEPAAARQTEMRDGIPILTLSSNSDAGMDDLTVVIADAVLPDQ